VGQKLELGFDLSVVMRRGLAITPNYDFLTFLDKVMSPASMSKEQGGQD
jgi:hypothetical protein